MRTYYYFNIQNKFQLLFLFIFVFFNINNYASEIRTERYCFQYKILSNETEQLVDITDTIVRIWTDSNQFKEYGHFLFGADSFNTFKKVKNNWYVRDCDQWKLFYSDKFKANHSVNIISYGLLETRQTPDTIYPPTPIKCKIKIKWGKSFLYKDRKYRVFDYKISRNRHVLTINDNYIFDIQNGIVGIILNGGKDTCWRQPL